MTYGTVLNTFCADAPAVPGRVFKGFSVAGAAMRRVLYPRELTRFDVQAGDILSLEGQVWLAGFDAKGNEALTALGLTAEVILPEDGLDAAPLQGWVVSMGGTPGQVRGAMARSEDAPLLLRAASDLTLWIGVPCTSDDLAHGGSVPVATVMQTADTTRLELLAPYLGEVRDEFTIPRGTAMAYELARGQVVQIIDVAGQQCSDFQAARLTSVDAARDHFIDPTATRSLTRRAFPGPGLFDKFYDIEMAPMLQLRQDTCGRHDTFGLACTARGYEERGFPGHISCSQNISDVWAPYGIERRSAWPAVNFFWSTWIDAHHQLCTEESYSRPGDYVAMEAMDDLLCVSTACPDDIDPINGWNPTDIHIRIYEKDTPLRRAVAYRPKEDAPMRISEQSPFHDRHAPLTDQFAPARDLWMPVAFPGTGTLGEYWACRERVTLQDMSSLRKLDIVGPDAQRLLQQALTRDVARLSVWRASYALICDAAGEVIDDGTLFRLGPELFRWCHGSEESARWLQELATDMGLQVRLHDLGGSLPNLALQGPKSRDVLREIAFTQPHVPALDQLKWFGVTVARLHDRTGAPFLISRTGYTGELGYELFCAKADALAVYDAVMAAGAAHGIVPMGGAALEMLRIEAGFMAAGQEFAPGVDADEAGLGFAVDMRKADFVGKDALARNREGPRKRLVGLMFDADDVPLHGAPVLAGERQVGVVTSATHSPTHQCAIAMARIGLAHSEIGTKLDVGQMDGRMKRLGAAVCAIPFVDPGREKPRA